MSDRPLALAQRSLAHAIARNTRLVVELRRLAATVHRRGRHHDVSQPWTGCDHAICTRVRHVIAWPA